MPLRLLFPRLSPPFPQPPSQDYQKRLGTLARGICCLSVLTQEAKGSEPGRGEDWKEGRAVGTHSQAGRSAGSRGAGDTVPTGMALLGAWAARARRRATQSGGSAGSMRGAGGDTNLWPRSPGCVRGKLLARDTGREKRNRESKEGCDSPGVLQDKEGTDGHIPSRGQGVTAWEPPAAPRTSTEPLSALQGGDVARAVLHPSPCSAGLLPSLASPTEHMEPNKPGLDSYQPSKCPDNPSDRVTWTQPLWLVTASGRSFPIQGHLLISIHQ